VIILLVCKPLLTAVIKGRFYVSLYDLFLR
jgi:hypothetical protein